MERYADGCHGSLGDCLGGHQGDLWRGDTMKGLLGKLKVGLLVLLPVGMTGCWVTDALLGREQRTQEAVFVEVDKDGDKELSTEEIKASPYDLDKDGTLSLEEFRAATAG